jgi:hypothetical protein
MRVSEKGRVDSSTWEEFQSPQCRDDFRRSRLDFN